MLFTLDGGTSKLTALSIQVKPSQKNGTTKILNETTLLLRRGMLAFMQLFPYCYLVSSYLKRTKALFWPPMARSHQNSTIWVPGHG